MYIHMYVFVCVCVMLVCECGLCIAMHMWKSEDNPGVSPHLLPRLRHGFLLFLHCVEQVRWPMYELLEILWSLPSISQEEHWDQRERDVLLPWLSVGSIAHQK